MLLDFVVELGDVSLELLVDDVEVGLVEDNGVDELVDVVEVWSPMS